MNSAKKVSLREERSAPSVFPRRAGQGTQVVPFPRPLPPPAVQPVPGTSPRAVWGRGLELSAAIAVNLALATVAIAALSRLIPYHQQEQERLRELSLELRDATERVDGLRHTLAKTMDARQSGAAMERREGWLAPGQVLVLPVEQAPSSARMGTTAVAETRNVAPEQSD